jgi:hypothetical protein
MSAGSDSNSSKSRIKEDTEIRENNESLRQLNGSSSLDSASASGSLNLAESLQIGVGEETVKGGSASFLELDDVAVDKIIADVLGGAGGIADIFSQEKAGGLFDSTAAAQATGDLAAKLTGEIARLTAKEVTEDFRVGTTTDATGTTARARALTLEQEQQTQTQVEDELTKEENKKVGKRRGTTEDHGLQTSSEFSLDF